MIDELKSKVQRLKGIHSQKERELKRVRSEYISAYREVSTTEKAQALIQRASQMTQDQLRYHITELGTTALRAVFEEDIKLDLQFTEQKDKTIANLGFLRGENPSPVDPMEGDSGGACDIASEALRDSLWYVSKPRSRSTMIRDEPAKNINDRSREMHHRYAEMIRQISDRLGVQFIIVTMIPEMMDVADKVFEIK